MLAVFLQFKQDKKKISLLFSHLPEGNDNLGLSNKYALWGICTWAKCLRLSRKF